MTLPSAVSLNDVKFRWAPHEPDVIDIAKLEVKRGEHLFVEGPSGCGKSTLLGLLGAVSSAQSGRIRVLDRDLGHLGSRKKDRFRADHIGFIFQMFNLLPYLSVIDNVMLPCRFSKMRRRRALQAGSGLRDQAKRLLSALDLPTRDLLARPVTELSIGQQQRVAAARALLGTPEIIIADEPTSALDEGTRERFLELLFTECNRHNTTIIFVSHDARLGQLFDHQLALASVNRARQSR